MVEEEQISSEHHEVKEKAPAGDLLGRVLNILCENNPELAKEKRRAIMKHPQLLREGTKNTMFVNFMDLSKTMHRQPDHVMAFLLNDLGTSGALDGQQRLVVKGRFNQRNFEWILRRYVMCVFTICRTNQGPVLWPELGGYESLRGQAA